MKLQGDRYPRLYADGGIFMEKRGPLTDWKFSVRYAELDRSKHSYHGLLAQATIRWTTPDEQEASKQT